MVGAAQAHSCPKECGLASDPFFRIEVSLVIVPLNQPRQFGFRGDEPRKAAIQADQDLREYEDARLGEILRAAEMDVYFSSEFRLTARCA